MDSPQVALPVRVQSSPRHGLGVFAAQAIARHSLIGEYLGTPADQDGVYVLWVDYDDGERVGIDGTNALRYLNHARQPNAHFRGAELYALCDIAAGEEITFDYGEAWADID
jgi:SET domain-containing protein